MVRSLPNELAWVSPRLTREIVARADADRGPWGFPTPTVEVPLTDQPGGIALGLGLDRAPRTYRDPVLSDAVRATQILAQRTGTIHEPNEYVRTVMDLHLAKFIVLDDWDGVSNQPISALYGIQVVEGIGRVALVLYGSPHNWRPDALPERYYGRTPSNMEGIYRIIEAAREPKDARPTQRAILHDADQTAEWRCSEALKLLEGIWRPTPSVTYEVLLQVFDMAEQLEVNEINYDRIILGTPVWAGRPNPQPQPPVLGIEDRRRDLWMQWEGAAIADAEAWNAYSQVPQLPDPSPLVDDETWGSFTRWFCDLGGRLGRPAERLLVHTRPPWWSPLRWVSRGWKDAEPRIYGSDTGYVVSIPGAHVLLTPQGKASPVMEIGRHTSFIDTAFPDSARRRSVYDEGVLYWPKGDDHFLSVAEGETPVDLASTRREEILSAAWAHAVSWRTYPFPRWREHAELGRLIRATDQ